MKKYGWAETTIEKNGVADRLFQTLNIEKTVFNYARLEIPKKQKAPTKMKLWECSCDVPKKIRYSKEDLNSICNDCESFYQLQD